MRVCRWDWLGTFPLSGAFQLLFLFQNDDEERNDGDDGANGMEVEQEKLMVSSYSCESVRMEFAGDIPLEPVFFSIALFFSE